MFGTLANTPELLAVAARLPPDRLPALLFTAATQYLVTAERPQPLARYFPAPGREQPPVDPSFAPAYVAFCSSRADALMELASRHRYQMNEVARATQLALGLGVATAGAADRPVGLVDLGTGAGLTLGLDRFRYDLDGRTFGAPAPAPVLRCAVRGSLAPPLPARLPPVVTRIGIDRDPIDVRDPAALRWLSACVPPEQESVARFEAAVELARRDPPRLVRGDAVDRLAELVVEVPPDALVAVLDSYTAIFFDRDRLDRLRATVADLGRRRDLAWVSLDPLWPLGPAGDESVQGLALPAGLVEAYRREGVFAVLGLVAYEGGVERRRLVLARAHPSGAWVEWLAG